MLVRILTGVDEMRARCNCYENTLGDGLEVRAKVARTFNYQNFVLRGFNTNMTKDLEIVCLHALARDDNTHAADNE
jgi:hypothetical protein